MNPFNAELVAALLATSVTTTTYAREGGAGGFARSQAFHEKNLKLRAEKKEAATSIIATAKGDQAPQR